MGVNDAAQLQKVQEQVAFYQSCYWACLVGTILFCCLAIFLCVYFHVLSIVMERLGIKRKRSLSQMDKSGIVHSVSYKSRERREYEEPYSNQNETIETTSSAEETVLLTDDVFVMEKDIVLSEARNMQKKGES